MSEIAFFLLVLFLSLILDEVFPGSFSDPEPLPNLVFPSTAEEGGKVEGETESSSDGEKCRLCGSDSMNPECPKCVLQDKGRCMWLEIREKMERPEQVDTCEKVSGAWDEYEKAYQNYLGAERKYCELLNDGDPWGQRDQDRWRSENVDPFIDSMGSATTSLLICLGDAKGKPLFSGCFGFD